MDQPASSLSRRDLLKLGGAALAVGAASSALTGVDGGGPDPEARRAGSGCAPTCSRSTSTRSRRSPSRP